MIQQDTIIQAKNLSVGYGNTLVWEDANFSIQKGEFIGILGPNGAGKTTFIRLLLGLLSPQKGELTIFGEKPKRGNIRIGYVPQRHLIDSEMRIEAIELVRLGISGTHWGIGSSRAAKQDRGKAFAMLRQVGGENLAHTPLGSLSGGELQRIFLAEALMGKPELLILDEPLSNLDIRREINLVGLIRDIATKANVTVLLIAHNINPLLSALDRVMYMANKRVAIGAPSDVLTSASLSALYGTPIEVLQDSLGRIAVIGAEETAHHHE